MIKDPHQQLKWVTTLYPITRLYMFLLYCLHLMRMFKIHMWRTFNVKWHLATYDEED